MSPFNVLKWLMVLRGIVKACKQPRRGMVLTGKPNVIHFTDQRTVQFREARALEAKQLAAMDLLRYQLDQQTPPYNSLGYQSQHNNMRVDLKKQTEANAQQLQIDSATLTSWPKQG